MLPKNAERIGNHEQLDFQWLYLGRRPLAHNPVPLVTETFIAAVYTPPDARSLEMLGAIETSNQLIAELQTASDYIFGVPMYNFSVPAGFKAYIDQIVIPGRTYTDTNNDSGRRTGLLQGKKATVILSRGWSYLFWPRFGAIWIELK